MPSRASWTSYMQSGPLYVQQLHSGVIHLAGRWDGIIQHVQVDTSYNQITEVQRLEEDCLMWSFWSTSRASATFKLTACLSRDRHFWQRGRLIPIYWNWYSEVSHGSTSSRHSTTGNVSSLCHHIWIIGWPLSTSCWSRGIRLERCTPSHHSRRSQQW